jgi:hypothetical protein
MSHRENPRLQDGSWSLVNADGSYDTCTMRVDKQSTRWQRDQLGQVAKVVVVLLTYIVYIYREYALIDIGEERLLIAARNRGDDSGGSSCCVGD